MIDKKETAAHAIASAPGDLPMPALQERHALQATQFRHDNMIEPSAPKPDQPVTVTAISGALVNVRRAEVWYTTDGRLPDVSSPKVEMTLAEVDWTPETSYLNRWQATLPPQPAGSIVRYRIAGYSHPERDTPVRFAHDGSGFWYRLGEAGLTNFAYCVADEPHTLPDWMADAVIYQIFLDRFRPDGTDFPSDLPPQARHGGTLRGVIAALPYLVDLGVNCLWLSPVGPSESYHRYDQTDFFAVDPDLGDLDVMRELVATAHQLGMRLILDFVPSHASWKMPEFVAAQEDRTAPTAPWFVFDEWPDRYRCFLGMVPFLVSLDGTDPGLRQFLIDSGRFWLVDVGFDGLRLDHAIGQGMDFWVAFSTALKTAKPDVALFGEVTDTPDMLRRYHGRLPGVLDFSLAQILRMSFGSGEWGVTELSGALRAHLHYLQVGPGRVTFFENHDMNRFLFVANGDVRRLKMAALCLLTLPFPPVLYYGTEIGLTQTADKDAGGFGGDHVIRSDMPWDPTLWDHDLRTFFQRAIALRHRLPVMRRGRWETLLVDEARQLLGYALLLDGAAVHVVFNFSREIRQLQREDSGQGEILLSTDPQNGWISQGDGAALTLMPLSGLVLGVMSP